MTLKYLLLLRHAKSSWSQDLPDHARPLNKRGRSAAKAVGGVLVAKGLVPKFIWSSDSARTKETVDRMFVDQSDIKTVYSNILYHASANTVLTFCNQQGEPQDGPLMLVGHNPGYEDLFGYFTNLSRHYPTGACTVLKRVDTEANWLSADAWQMRDLILPREIMAR